jgi:putative ABC transport system permease protein
MVPVKYNVRSLLQRTGTTLMTVGSIAFVVLVYVGVLALAGGVKTAFAAAGDPATVLVLRDGARSEMESGYSTDTLRLVQAMPGVARDDAGQPIASGETITLQILQRGDGTESNVTIRGVEPAAFALRPEITIVEGRNFEAGKNEVIVGAMMPDRYPSLRVGSDIQLGRNDFRVVGVFECGGSSYCSEVWGDTRAFGDSYRRGNFYSSTRVKAADVAVVDDLIASIKADQRLRVSAMAEPEYYQQQTDATSLIFVVLGNSLAVLMGFGACFAAANTMYAQVAARGKEIGTLRAMGFRRRSILAAFLIEALVLGLLASGVGVLLSLPLNGFTAQTMNNATFSEITFSLRTTPQVLLGGVGLAVITAVIGGFLPAWSASRRPITTLLREA